MVYLRIHSWCCTFYGFGQMDDDMGASRGKWWLSGKSTHRCRRHRGCRFGPCVGKISWRRKWQPTPVFLPGKSHRQRILVGCSPRGRKELDTTYWLNNNMMTWRTVTLSYRGVSLSLYCIYFILKHRTSSYNTYQRNGGLQGLRFQKWHISVWDEVTQG